MTDKYNSAWQWIICFIVPFAVYLEASVPHSFGTFIANFRNTTDIPLATLDWLPTCAAAMPCLLLPITITLVRKYSHGYYRCIAILGFVIMSGSCFISSIVPNPVFLFLSFSIIYGLGAVLVLTLCYILLSEYFPVEHKYHIFATSLFQLGYPASAFTLNPFTAFLISQYNWQFALRIHGVLLFFIGGTVGFLFKHNDEIDNSKVIAVTTTDSKMMNVLSSEEKTTDDDSQDEATPEFDFWKEFKCRPQTIPWLLSKYLNYACWFSIRTNLVFVAANHNSTNKLLHSSAIMLAYAGAEILWCLICATISPWLKNKLIYFNLAAALLMALITFLWMTVATSYLLMLMMAFFLGSMLQITLYFGYPTSAEVLKLELSMSWTITMVAAGLGIFSSPLLGGILYDRFLSIDILFYAQGVGWSLQAILLVLCIMLMRKCNLESSYQEL